MITAGDLVEVLTWVAILGTTALIFGGLLVAVLNQQKLRVQDDVVVDAPAHTVALDVDRCLQQAHLPGALVRLRAPGQAQVVVREAPGWAIIPTILFFPLGALALLIRQDVVLDVYTFDTGAATVVRLSGVTRKPVLLALRRELAHLHVAAV